MTSKPHIWTTEDEEVLRQLYTGGQDLARIATRFDTTKDAIKQKAHRLGLKRPRSTESRRAKGDLASRLRVLLGEEIRPPTGRRLFSDEELLRFAGKGAEPLRGEDLWSRVHPDLIDPRTLSGDALRLLRGLDLFCREVVGLKLMDHQLAMAYCCLASKRAICLAGRQSGKDYTQASLALWEAVVLPNSRIVVVSGAQRQSDALMEKVLGFVARDDKLYDSVLRSSREAAHLTNGSFIKALPATGIIRGETATRVLVNEARDILNDEETYSAVEPMLLVTNGHLGIFTTPLGKTGRIWEAFSSPLYLKTRIPSRASKYATPEHLETQKLEMSAARYANEYEAEFLDVQSAYFSPESIQGCAREYDLTMQPESGLDYAVGVDWARTRDTSVMIVVGRDDEDLLRLHYIKAFLNVPMPDQVAFVRHLHNVFRFHRIVSEYAGLGIGPTDQLERDLAVGSGTLLAKSYERKKRLMELDGGEFDEESHRRYVEEQITGIDIMPFAAHLSAIQLALEGPHYETDRVRIAIRDSTELEPGVVVQPISHILPRARRQRRMDNYEESRREVVETGAVSPRGFRFETFQINPVELVIMNPPFTRFQRLARFGEDYPDELRSRFTAYSDYIDGRMPYCNYFLLLADKFLVPEGRVAAVLPATILRGDSSNGIRRFLRERYTIDKIIIRHDARNFSEDTAFQEILLVAQKGGRQRDFLDYVILDRLEGQLGAEIESVARHTGPGQAEAQYDGFIFRRMPWAAVAESNMFRPIAVHDRRLLDLLTRVTELPAFVPLSNLAAEIQSKDQAERGGPTFSRISLNAVDSEELGRDDWQVERADRTTLTVRHRGSGEEVAVPRQVVRPLFRRTPYRRQYDVSNLEEFVVVDGFDDYGRFAGLADLRDVNWTRWQEYLNSRTSNLGITDRFDMTARGSCLIAYYDDRERVWARNPAAIVGLSPERAKTACLWFNSTPGILQVIAERMPTRGGYMQLHKFIFKDLPVPDWNSMPPEGAERVMSSFEAFRETEFPSIVEQFARLTSTDALAPELRTRLDRAFPSLTDHIGSGFAPRVEMDGAILAALGLDDSEVQEITQWLYPSMLSELLVLYEIMVGRA